MNAIKPNTEIRSYLYDFLFTKILNQGCPRTLNIQRSFRDHLALKEHLEDSADELSEKWHQNLLYRIEQNLSEAWDGLGVPRPIALLDNDNTTLVTWSHPRYSTLTGLGPLPEEFIAIVNWLQSLDPREFLIPCACLLSLIGAEHIYITEGTGDGGIDCIGKIENGPLRSLCLFVQAKTSNSGVKREILLTEYGKFKMLPFLRPYQQYLEKLQVENSFDGMGISFLIVSNNEFLPGARSAASTLGIILRSRKQLAYWLSTKASLAELEKLLKELHKYVQRDASINLAPHIQKYLKVDRNWDHLVI